ncbi:MAG TPA: hypothetical protein VEH83_10265 [Gemmatimonadales bacterium]|nr:hypothetical protein [Gemmatimonadales bacterium]
MTPRSPAALLAALLLSAAAAGAQNPPPARPAPADTARAAAPANPTDTTGRARADTTPVPDSLRPDSFLPQLPRLGAPPGPLPKAGRIVFDHDALWFSGALSLGELLAKIPGVFLARAGWFGRPEVLHYAGQGAASVELFWDGFAMDPLGRDSAGFDLSQISLGLLQRVEVEVLPTVLRVYLFSDAQLVRRPRTETSFATGDASTNTYRIRYLNRWKDGVGVGVGVEFLGTAASNSSTSHSNNLTVWGKGSWSPSPRLGVEYQAVSMSVDRDGYPVNAADGTPFTLPNPKSHRSDVFFRGFAATRDDGMGLRFDALAGSTSYTDSSAALDRSELQGAAILGYRAERWSSDLTARVRDTSTPFELQLRAAASPLSLLTVSGSVDGRTHTGARHSLDASLGAELRPWRALAIHGAARLRDAVASPAVLTDTAQKVTDVSGGVSVTGSLADLDVTYTRHGAFRAPVYGIFDSVVPGYPSLAVRTVSASFAFRPALFLSLAGWYRHPLDPVTSAYEPPHHARVTATFRSRLLPILRRNAFDFTAEVGVESWSHGAMGVDANNLPVRLPGAVVFDYRAEMRLLGAALFWTIRNARDEHYALVPGVPMPPPAQRYGVRWEFTN